MPVLMETKLSPQSKRARLLSPMNLQGIQRRKLALVIKGAKTLENVQHPKPTTKATELRVTEGNLVLVIALV